MAFPYRPFIIGSGLLHCVYFYLVGAMYAHAGGDVSTVYPIARGTGMLTVFWQLVLGCKFLALDYAPCHALRSIIRVPR